MRQKKQPLPGGQLALFDESIGAPPFSDEASSTFADNISLPVHGWFKYPAGFSALWVRDLLLRERANGRETVFEPFAGSGTVLLEGESCGMVAVGVEAHPFVARVARAKLLWRTEPEAFLAHAQAVLAQARASEQPAAAYPPLIAKCFGSDSLARLDALRRALAERADGSPSAELAWLALASILRGCSSVGTAPWQYILPRKSKARVADPFEAFEAKVSGMATDMAARQARVHGPSAALHWEDARQSPSLPGAWADLVITSPPYANNYDYADATRLEMSFFGEIQGWGDLQAAVRHYLVRSCTQHIAKEAGQAQAMLASPELEPLRPEIQQVCQRLEAERSNHGGKKPYHAMIAAYFQDMAQSWTALRRITKDGALVCFVIGDSAPYGVHVPVERWMGALAIAAGFKAYRFEKLRDRNLKWQNRKHRVPLQEGRLWVEG